MPRYDCSLLDFLKSAAVWFLVWFLTAHVQLESLCQFMGRFSPDQKIIIEWLFRDSKLCWFTAQLLVLIY